MTDVGHLRSRLPAKAYSLYSLCCSFSMYGAVLPLRGRTAKKVPQVLKGELSSGRLVYLHSSTVWFPWPILHTFPSFDNFNTESRNKLLCILYIHIENVWIYTSLHMAFVNVSFLYRNFAIYQVPLYYKSTLF